MSEKFREEMKDLVLKYALKNAVEHDGKAIVGPVISKVFGERPDLRPFAKDIVKIVAEIVAEVNKLSIEEQKKLLEERYPEVLREKKVKEVKPGLPPLPNASKYKEIVTRFAPNPDYLIHLGNARPAILSSEYASMYNGKMILRFEDTDPRIKKPLPEAYGLIKEDLKWLGVKWHEEYIQSLRMNIYYDIAKKLIEVRGAYVDLCKPETFRKFRFERKACPHRNMDVEQNLELWDKMINGYFNEGEAVLRIKTDLQYHDPSVIDWVAFRIIDTDKNPHPITGSKYVAWPTYNFAAAIDDYLMRVTHILRAKEHLTNTLKQRFLYKHLKWEYPETIHFGRLKLEGFILSKSKIKDLIIKAGLRTDDIRFGLLASLRRRGILPETIRQIILDVGVKGTDATISWDNLVAVNRKILDPKVIRLMFVRPVELEIKNLPKCSFDLNIPNHPTNQNLGIRKLSVKCVGNNSIKIYIDRDDVKFFKLNKVIRLMEFMNVSPLNLNKNKIVAQYHSTSLSEARKHNAPIIQWVPAHDYVEVKVIRNQELKLIIEKGIAETNLMNVKLGEILQFIRYGFVKVEKKMRKKVLCVFTHE